MIPPIIENATGRFMNVTLSHEFVSWMGWTNEPPKVSGSYWFLYFYATKREFSTAIICDFDADEQGGGKAVRVFHDGSQTEITCNMYFWPEPIKPPCSPGAAPQTINTMTMSDFHCAKRQLETELTASMTERLLKFQEQYGIAPDRITVDLQTVHMICDARPKFIGCTVFTEIKV